MRSFILASAVGLSIVCSMFGLGWLLAKILRMRNGRAVGSNAALGLGLTAIFAELLKRLHADSPVFPEAYLLTGVLCAFFAAAKELPQPRFGIESVWRRVKEHKSIAMGAVLVAVLTFSKFAIAIPSLAFHSAHAPSAHIWNSVFSILIAEAKDPHLMDFGVALIVLILLLAEIMLHKGASALSVILVLLIVALFQPPVSDTASIYSMVVFFVLLFKIIAGAKAESGFADCFVLALLFASITVRNWSLAPAAVVVVLGYFALRLRNTFPGWQPVAWQALLCAVVSAALLAPLMLPRADLLNSLHDSDALNPSSFPHGIQNTLFVIFTIQAGLLLIGRHSKQGAGVIDSLIACFVILSLPIAALFAADGAMAALSLPLIFSAVLYLFTGEFATPNTAAKAFPSFYSAVTSILLAGIMLGAVSEDFIASEKDWLLALKSSLAGSL